MVLLIIHPSQHQPTPEPAMTTTFFQRSVSFTLAAMFTFITVAAINGYAESTAATHAAEQWVQKTQAPRA